MTHLLCASVFFICKVGIKQYLMSRVVIRTKLDKSKNKIVSLGLIVPMRKVISQRFLAAVLLLCSFFSSWDPEEPCATSDRWEASDVQHEK